MKHISIFAAALCLCGLSVPSYGQMSDFDRAFTRQGAEARVSFTIPLGNSADKTKTAPRLGFAVRNYNQSSRSSTDWMRSNAEPYREMRLGLTLENTPQLMLNDEVLLPSQDEQANIGTAGKIGLGVGAVVVALVTIVGVIVLICSDSDDPDCSISAGG